LNLLAISRLLLSTCSRFLVSSRRLLTVPRLFLASSCRIDTLDVSNFLLFRRARNSRASQRGSSSPLVGPTRGSPALPRLELSNRYTRRLEFLPIPPSSKFEGKSSPILTRLENARNNVSPNVNT
jgi:hypothetical protein